MQETCSLSGLDKTNLHVYTCMCVYMCMHGTQHKEEWWVGEEFLPIQKGCVWSVAKKKSQFGHGNATFMKNLDTNLCARMCI